MSPSSPQAMSQQTSVAPSILSEEPTVISPEDKIEQPAEAPAIVAESDAPEIHEPPKKDLAFWLVIVSLMMSSFLSAIDLTAVSTALPTIVDELSGGAQFVWVGSAYSLASTAILPLAGNFATIFGRRLTLLTFLTLFAVGSAMTASAQSMPLLIAGRGVQGLGGGGILGLTEIIIADLVSLSERGVYMGIFGSVWAFASAIGPPVGGGLAGAGAWRWLFYLNLPLTGVAFVLVLTFMNLRRPPGSIVAKLAKVDWSGNALAITSSTILIVALVEGGVEYPWNSAQVLAPLIIGLAGLGAFVYFEARWVKEPTLPFDILSNMTSLSGYAGTFVHGLVTGIQVFYLPVYFQATLLADPIQSGVDMFSSAFVIAPFAILTGASVTITHHYKTQNVLGWMLITIGAGLLSLLDLNSSRAAWAGYQVVISAGVGILFAGTTFPVLAPLPVTKTAHALAFFTFVRAFAQTVGVSIGSTVLQNELVKNLPAQLEQLLPGGTDIAYAAIPEIGSLPEPLQDEVRAAFASSLRVLWLVTVGIGGLGFLTSLVMRQLDLHEVTDEEWGMEQREKKVDEEKAAA